MALFKGIAGPLKDQPDQYFRTNTKLQAGTHDSPGEKFLIDPRLKRLFRYHFGGDGWVVIPKGRAIAPSNDDGGQFKNGTIHDFDGNVYRPVITLANGGQDVTELDKEGNSYTRAANRSIGLAYANLYEEFVDGFNRMQPTVENTIYVELPYIPNKVDAEEIEWGSFYDADPARPVKAGDYVIPDADGRIIKADFEKVRTDIAAAKAAAAAAGTLADLSAAVQALADAETEYTRLSEQTLGQVWAVETNLPPQGWLKWVGWSDEQVSEDNWKQQSGMSSDDIGAQGDFPGYPYEKTYRNWDPKTNRYYPQGIPGLTDGSNIVTDFTKEKIGDVQAGASGRHDFRIMQTPVVEGSVKLYTYDGATYTDITANIENIHHESGLITFSYDNTAGTSPLDIVVDFKATGQIPGVPTGWDWKGSVGAIRILLQK